MLPDRVSNPGPLTYESSTSTVNLRLMTYNFTSFSTVFKSVSSNERLCAM